MRPACPAARPDIKDEPAFGPVFARLWQVAMRRGRVGAVVSSMGHAPHSSEPRPARNSNDNAAAPPDAGLRPDRCADGPCDDRGWLRRRAIVVAVAVLAGPPIDTHAPIAAGDPVGARAPDHRSDVAVHGVAGTLDHGETGLHRHPDPHCDRIAAPDCHGYPGAHGYPGVHGNTDTSAHGDTGSNGNTEPFSDTDRRRHTESDGDAGDLIESDAGPGDTRAIGEPRSRFQRDHGRRVTLADPVGGRARDRPCRSVRPVSRTRPVSRATTWRIRNWNWN